MWALIADSDDLLNADVSEWLKAMTFADMDLGDEEGVRKFLGAEAKDLLEASESPASHATPWMRFDADDVNEDAFSRSTCDECYDATLWPASYGGDGFREILTGKAIKNRHRRTW